MLVTIMMLSVMLMADISQADTMDDLNCCCSSKQTIEGGEYMQVADTGFHSPTDNSQDPPGTITLPLPDTVYSHPKPGESATSTEMSLPTFNIPSEMLNGRGQQQSVTLDPVGKR